MIEEEHRHEERVHRHKGRALEKERKHEERRRKRWEEYEKCLQRASERSDKHITCEEPTFLQKESHKYTPGFEEAVSERSEDEEEDWTEDEGGYASSDYDFSAEFRQENG
jgi:hypothetical protein